MPNKDKLKIELAALLNTHNNPFVIIDEEYTVVAANQAYCDKYGKTVTELADMKCYQVSHKRDAPCSLYNNNDCPMEKVMVSGKQYEALQIHHDRYNQSEHIRIIGFPIVDIDGKKYIGEKIIHTDRAAEAGHRDQQLIGRSEAFLSCMEMALKAADSEANLLISGESGVGKDRVAQYIHHHSHRSGKPFITLKCATTNPAFLGSELFGHEKGALPAFKERRKGLIDDANGGTLQLDGIGDLSQDLQARLLHFIETGQYTRVGGEELLESDVRIITTENQGLEEMMGNKEFRSDLYYRISSFTFTVPPLRERREDIPLLIEHTLDKLNEIAGKHYVIDKEARSLLSDYQYPGNIRELENLLLRASNLCNNGSIGAKHIMIKKQDAAAKGNIVESEPHDTHETFDEQESIKSIESSYIKYLLEKHGGHRRKVANILGISERTLYRKLDRYNLTRTGRSSHDT